MPGRLDGKVCVITGAASGIGAESARLFAAEGAKVVGVDVAEGSEGELALQADVTDEEQVRGMYERTKEEFGRIDVLFNNAGINPTDDSSAIETLAGGLAAGPGRQPARGLPLLQARDPAPAGGRGRVGDQHRVLRRRDGRRRLADLLHGLEGRRCWRSRASSGSSSPTAACASTRSARGRSTRRFCRSCSQRTRRRPSAASSTCRWADSPRRSEIAQGAALSGQRRVLVCHRLHLHGRRRPLRRLHHAGVAIFSIGGAPLSGTVIGA